MIIPRSRLQGETEEQKREEVVVVCSSSEGDKIIKHHVFVGKESELLDLNLILHQILMIGIKVRTQPTKARVPEEAKVSRRRGEQRKAGEKHHPAARFRHMLTLSVERKRKAAAQRILQGKQETGDGEKLEKQGKRRRPITGVREQVLFLLQRIFFFLV